MNKIAEGLLGVSTGRVSYAFRTELEGPLREQGDGGGAQADAAAEWSVRAVYVHEPISAPYLAEIDLSGEESLDPGELVGKSCLLTIQRDAHREDLCGLITRVTVGGRIRDRLQVRVCVEPALRALEQRVNSRIFSEMSSVEIIEQVLGEGLDGYGRGFRNELQAEQSGGSGSVYPVREYTVQYRETDLAFITRLMERDGISYFFDHTGEYEQMVLVDTSDQYPAIEGDPDSPVPLVAVETEQEALSVFHLRSRVTSTSVTVRDYDWTRPQKPFEARVEPAEPPDPDREIYHHSELSITGYDSGAAAYAEVDDKRQAEVKGQALAQSRQLFVGRGTVTGFRPGKTFKLESGASGEQSYLLTGVTHELPLSEAPEAGVGGGASAAASDAVSGRTTLTYRNGFECIRFDEKVPYRPPRKTDKPRITGMQTATVVGPPGEEVYTDEHGRIKVRFHWDRLATGDDKSSCWIRVAQSWAGTGFGTLFIPRINMEVLVTFLEGDPDRPLVVGCVYNGYNRLPADHEMPANKTRSFIRTFSSPRNDGYNEIMLEDAAGEELISVHAQKDYSEVVENDHSTEVRKNQTNQVKASQSESVGASQTLTVGGERTKTVKKDETITVEKNRTQTVLENETVTIEGERSQTVVKKQTIELQDEQQVTITGKDTLTVNNDKADHVTGEYTVDADTKFKLTQGGTSLTLESDHVELDAAAFIKALHGSGTLEIADDGSITLESGATITLKVGGSQVVISQQAVEIKSMQVSVAGQTGELTVDATGGKLAGPMVTIEGQAMTEIKGGMVKIN